MSKRENLRDRKAKEGMQEKEGGREMVSSSSCFSSTLRDVERELDVREIVGDPFGLIRSSDGDEWVVELG